MSHAAVAMFPCKLHPPPPPQLLSPPQNVIIIISTTIFIMILIIIIIVFIINIIIIIISPLHSDFLGDGNCASLWVSGHRCNVAATHVGLASIVSASKNQY
jgi:hypothetical protein